ncbi:MAG: tail sheath stabilizer and completion protein [Candidatus Shapirobacteria bacterium]
MSHFYYKALRNTNLKFLQIFNDIEIAKYDKNGNIIKYVTVPVKWAPKEKSYQWARDQKHEKSLPMIAVQLISIEPDSSRITGKNQEIYTTVDSEGNTYDSHVQPSPYILDYQVSIISNYSVEMDQILEAIFSAFNPYIFIRIKVSEYNDETYDLKVILTSATPDYNLPGAEDEYRWIVYNLTFTIQAQFFKQLSVDNVGVINSVIRRYWTNETAFDNRATETTFTSGASGTTYPYSAKQTFLGYDESAAMMIQYEIFDSD